MGYSKDLRVRVIQVVEGRGGAGCCPAVCDRRFNGDPMGEALAGERQL